MQLFGRPHGVVFHPEFLHSSNPVLPINYDACVRGTHVGIFSLYHEPRGYTTDLSGFGYYMEEVSSCIISWEVRTKGVTPRYAVFRTLWGSLTLMLSWNHLLSDKAR